jgi:hypothetical protein
VDETGETTDEAKKTQTIREHGDSLSNYKMTVALLAER